MGATWWPAVTAERMLWTPRVEDAGMVSRRARRSGQYDATIPAFIAGLPVALDGDTGALIDNAGSSLARFDQSLAGEVSAFEPLLLRSESSASSRIEQLTASARAILTAEATGRRRSGNAAAIVSNTRAMMAAIDLADRLSVRAVRRMHEVLMAGEPSHTPGRFRTEPVWIGRSALSPIGAEFVGPESSRIPDLLDDLMAFTRRPDIPVLAQAAIAHAQFETIHPFTDGNGRTGRALLQAMLRAGDLTRSITVPVSAGLLTDVAEYHRALTAYRAGDVVPIVRMICEASIAAIVNASALVNDLRVIRAEWEGRVTLRAGAGGRRLLDLLVHEPVLTIASAASRLGIATQNVYRAARPLVAAGIVVVESSSRPVLLRADDVLGALDDFAARAGRRGRPAR